MASIWLPAEQAAARLGVKPQTLYAYVSRGLIRSEPVPGAPGRVSRYDGADIERLAARRRAGGRAGRLELLVDTEMTLLDPAGHLYYRGRDTTELARAWSFERTAEWLWTGRDEGEPPAWSAPPAAVEAVRAVAGRLSPGASLVDRMRVACLAAATTDPLRHDRRPEAVVLTGRQLVSALLEALPGSESGAGGRSAPGGVAQRLWLCLAPAGGPGGGGGRVGRRASTADAGAALIDTALVLLADHELAASTLAARVAASTWADPYLVVETGLGVLGGPLHGAASAAALELLVEAEESSAPEAVGRRLRDDQLIPGLGHAVYTGADPRSVALMEAVRAVADPERLAVVEDVIEVVSGRGLPAPNIDLAVAALCHCFGLRGDAGEAMFAVARCAGWLGHAIEEYAHRLRFRPRAVYTGPRPGADPGAI